MTTTTVGTPVNTKWKELAIGGIAPAVWIYQLETAGVAIVDSARSMMEHDDFKVGSMRKINLARCRVRDLGFEKNPSNSDLLARIRQVGSPCDAEAGPAIRFATLDQSNGDVFCLAMEPIPAVHPPPCVFRVERDDYGRLWLLGYQIGRDFKWPLDYEVVFVLDE